MPTLQEIQKKISQRNSDIDEIISSGLLKEIEDYQREYEREIITAGFDLTENGRLKKTGKNFAKATAIDAKMDKKFRKIADNHASKYDSVANQSLDFVKFLGFKQAINFIDVSLIKELKNLDFSSLYGQSRQLDLLIKRQLVNAIAGGANFKTATANLSKQLLGAGDKEGVLARYSNTYMRTSLFSLSNSVDKAIYDQIGGNKEDAKYLYAGPILDKRIRPFCVGHVGHVFTVKEIKKFPIENGSGLDPFSVAPGGWNCRHRLILVNDKMDIKK